MRSTLYRVYEGLLLVSLCALVVSCGFSQRAEKTPVQSGVKAPAPARPAPVPGDPEPLSRYGNPEFYDVFGTRYVPMKSARGYRERGIASWYGPDFHGGLTSTREAYDMHKMTGAHKLLPLPTWVEVTNLENGRKTTLRVNDRGPFKDNRIIDLSYAAAVALDIVKPGTAFVEVRALDAGDAPAPAATPAMQVAAPSARMYLQVGAFGERANAERLQEKLAASFPEGVRIFMEPAETPPLYKVQLGPVRDVAHADQMAETLADIGLHEHHFVNN